MKNKATIITHQGWADFYSSNGLINHYAKLYEELVVFACDQKRKHMLTEMYLHIPNVKVAIPNTKERNDDNSTCLICHTNLTKVTGPCPRESFQRCKFISYDQYTNYENIKIGAFKNFQQWIDHMAKSSSFAHAFYSFENLDPSIRISSFSVADVTQDKIPYTLPYVAVHDDPLRGFVINLDRSLLTYNLNMKSETMIDQIKLIENANAIHMIDSNYSVLIYLLSFHNNKIKHIPKYLHSYTRTDRSLNIYTDPKPENWKVL